MRLLAALALLTLAPAAAEDAAPLTAAEAETLVTALADDDTRSNANDAARELRWRHSPDAARALERVLDSPDLQQRSFAAMLLAYTNPAAPSPRLLEVLVEGLANNGYPRSPEACNAIYDAAVGSRYLLDHAEAAKPFLIPGLRSEDLQQRFLCAFLLGQAGVTDELDRCVEILIPHLRDNSIPDDACAASHALYRLGPGVLPHLQAALKDADEQQRALIVLIARDLADPPVTRSDLVARKSMHRITGLFHDPARSNTTTAGRASTGTSATSTRCAGGWPGQPARSTQ